MSKTYTVRTTPLNPFSNDKIVKVVHVDDSGKRSVDEGHGRTWDEAERNARSGSHRR